MMREVNNHFPLPDESVGIGGLNVVKIMEHDWKYGHLSLKVQWNGGDTSWEQLRDMREHYPKITARYICKIT